MSYLLLILEHPERRRNRSVEARRSEAERMASFAEDLRGRGVWRASESLRVEGIRVSVRGGKRMIVDGPFAEAKEMVGGFFLLDCPTREDAIAIAQECPATAWATVEVREVGPCSDD